MTVNPITPEEAHEKKASTIPDFVIEAFNELIAENFNGKSSTVGQSDVIDRITTKNSIERHVIFRNNWLDVESVYEQSGWSVVYDKPGYNETYEATFTFTKK
jgi:hypothetical protein